MSERPNPRPIPDHGERKHSEVPWRNPGGQEDSDEEKPDE